LAFQKKIRFISGELPEADQKCKIVDNAYTTKLNPLLILPMDSIKITY